MYERPRVNVKVGNHTKKDGDHTYVYKWQNSKQVYRHAPNEKEMFKRLSLPLGNMAHGQYDFL